jgi:hypothetical protein
MSNSAAKHAKPVISPDLKSMFGYMRGTVQIQGDIVAPSDEFWSALSGDEDELYSQGSSTRDAVEPSSLGFPAGSRSGQR